jgi:YVTN family beta-propeller protein
MYGNNSNGNGAAWARGFAALWAVLAIGLGLAAFPAEAQPFAYVANGGSDTVSVIDTATKMVVTTVGVGMVPDGVAVTPNGKHVYVANFTPILFR